MATYLINYDLNAPGQDYDVVKAAIIGASDGAYWRALKSCWLINSQMNITQVTDAVEAALDSSDQFIVVDVTGRPRGWNGFEDEEVGWIRETWQAG